MGDDDGVDVDPLQKAKELALKALENVLAAANLTVDSEVANDEDGVSWKNQSKASDPKENSVNAETSNSAHRQVPKRPRARRVYDTPAPVGDSPEGDADEDDFAVVPEEISIPEGYVELAEVLARFSASGKGEDGADENDPAVHGNPSGTDEQRESENVKESGFQKNVPFDDDSDEEGRDGLEQNEKSGDQPLSERQQRRRKRLTVSQLKAVVRDPGVVEQWDVTAADPLMLVHLKASLGAVPVPVNWRQKRKYLQSKRGMEKTLFKLPQYIEDTGIGVSRAAIAEAEAAKTAKQKSRERIRPKSSGRGVDIDYSVMRDAFFKFQTKPRLTSHGDLYYELREREVKHENFRPGVLSASLREALGIGPSDPAPWLVAMQRYGPPPSYPNLEIPGLNAPIPVGASFGYHAGGWGKPPVDEYGRPLYGDVFGEGTKYAEADSRFDLTQQQKGHMWGEINRNVFDEEEEAAARRREEMHNYIGDGEVDNADNPDMRTRADASAQKEDEKKLAAANAKAAAVIAPTSTAEEGGGGGEVGVVASGVETPAAGIELRKGLAPGQLFTVLEQKSTSVGATGLMGSSHVYDMKNTDAGVHANGDSGDGGERQGDTLLKKRRAEAPPLRSAGDGRDAKKAKEAERSKEFKF